jgi:hydrogenase maturation protease
MRMRIVHDARELLDGYDALVIVDAVDRSANPGALYVLEPELPPLDAFTDAERHRLAADTHQAVPASTLTLARALGVLPRFVRIVGCQPESTEELSLELSAPVRAAVPAASEIVLQLVAACRANVRL